MATYQILFHGFGFDVSLDDDSESISGFYTTRRVGADGPNDAYLVALERLRSEETTKSLISQSLANGGSPQFEAEEIIEVPFWRRLFGRVPEGFIFYTDSEEEESPR